jgi:hypothetical protein
LITVRIWHQSKQSKQLAEELKEIFRAPNAFLQREFVVIRHALTLDSAIRPPRSEVEKTLPHHREGKAMRSRPESARCTSVS